MKTETKLKIINIVKRLLKWEEPVIQPFIIEERKVKIARFYHIYHKQEFDWLKEKDGLKRIVHLSIMEEIAKVENAIQYTEEPAPEFGRNMVRVEAFLLFVLPKSQKDIPLSELAKEK